MQSAVVVEEENRPTDVQKGNLVVHNYKAITGVQLQAFIHSRCEDG